MTALAMEKLQQLRGYRQTGQGQYQACCPNHKDQEASLSISEKSDGTILLHCFAGCLNEDILNELGLKMQDLFPEGGRGRYITPQTPTQQCNTLQGCTLREYAEAKKLPLNFLKSLGLDEITYQKVKAVKIPYYGPDGEEKTVQFRLSIQKGIEADNCFKWRSGSKTIIYGLWKLQDARNAEYIAIVEGASDCHTLWFNAIPAVGLPGAANWNDSRDADHFEGIDIVYVVIEPDAGGEGGP